MTKKIIYWFTTLALALFMTTGGVVQIIQPEWNAAPLQHLGYPLYFFCIIGTWKILASIAILIPKFPLVKEWAYAGLFFTMNGAFITHLELGDPGVQMISPIVFTAFIIISWHLRPTDRKLAVSGG